jgi:hypothetical protein
MNRLSSRDAAIEFLLYAVPVYLPFYQSLLLHGVARAAAVVILAVLLMFLASRKADLSRLLAACVSGWSASIALSSRRLDYRDALHEWLWLPSEPSLPSLSQRPPPCAA